MVYLIGYHLQKLGKDYSPLMDMLTKSGARRVLLSQWLLSTTRSAAELARAVREHMDERDRLLITEVGSDAVWFNLFLTDAPMGQLLRGGSPLPASGGHGEARAQPGAHARQPAT